MRIGCSPRSFRAGLAAAVAALTIASAAVIAQGPTQGWLGADLLRLKNLGEVQISPDARRIAYTIQTNDRTGRGSSQMWVWDVATGTTRRAGGDKDAGGHLRWSPDGQWLAYVGRAEDEAGLAIVKPDGSPAIFLARLVSTNHPLPSTGDVFTWSPGSSRIAYTSGTPGPEGDDANGDPMVLTRYLYKPTAAEGLSRFNDNRRLNIWAVDLVTREPRQLTDGNYYNHSLEWSPKGDQILFVSNHQADPDRVFNYDVFALPVATGTVRQITKTAGAEYRPTWSPDGLSIAMLATTRALTSSETTMEDTHVWVMKADGTARREVGAAIDNRQGAPRWSGDGKWLYFTVQERGDSRLYRIAAAGGPPEPIAPAAGEHASVTSWSIARDGTLAYGLATPSSPAELYLRSPDGQTQSLTALNADVVKSRSTTAVERFTVKAADGLEIESFLTMPANRNATSRHPLIVMLHGGPHGEQGPDFNLKAQTYATRGWATLMVNYRGSTGYGQAFADAIAKDQDGGEARDVLAAVDAALVRYPWLDAARLGVEGGSYGGQLTNWLITQTDRFKAAIPMAGIANLVSFNYTAYYHDYLAVEFGSFPHENGLMDTLWERSPLRYVSKVRTPTLILHGENDNDVPVSEAEQWYIALKDVGVDTVMVRYPREGHGVREPRHVVDAMDRSIAWYDRYLEGKPASAKPKK